MTRPVPSGLLSVLTQSSVLAGECLVLVATDGTTVGFTSLDEPQVLDLSAAGGPASVTCDQGMVLSAITLAAGLDSSFAEVQGPIGPVITEAQVNGGKWDSAEGWLVRVSPGTAGYAPILRGKVREPRVEDSRFVLQIRNQADALNQPIGRTITAYCDAKIGDARCGVALVPVAATVTGVTDALRLTVSYSGSYADGWFNFGELTFTSGALDGVTSENIFAFDETGSGTGTLVLFEDLPALPAIGDTLDLFRGCSKIRKADDPTVPTCLTYDNVVNFRGFPDVPGTDQVLRYPNPGA